jgi:hypothetical protein
MPRWARCRGQWCWDRSARWQARSSDIRQGLRSRVHGAFGDLRRSPGTLRAPAIDVPRNPLPKPGSPQPSSKWPRGRLRRPPRNRPRCRPRRKARHRFRDLNKKAAAKKSASAQKSSCPVGQITCINSISKNEARAGKPAAGFFNRTATRISGRTILHTAHCRKASQSALPSEPLSV